MNCFGIKNVQIQPLISSPVSHRSLTHVFWRGTLRQAEVKFQSITHLDSVVEFLSCTDSMTKSLEKLTNSEIHVQRTQPLEMLSRASQGMVPGPLVHRSKILRSDSETPLLFAQSWWNAGIYEEIMTQPEVPIWYNFEQKGIIPVRNILGLFLLFSPDLQAKLGRNEEGFLGREYVFIHNDRIMTAIVEIVGIATMKKFL